jgi:mono/diheme cytochrome c family protein
MKPAITLAAVCLCLVVHRSDAAAPSPQALELFETKVRPLLVENCVGCHGPKKQQGGLRLDSKTAFLKGGDNGAVVDAAKPEESTLLTAVRYDGDLKMPPKGALPKPAVDTLTEWIKAGAPWPDDVAPPLKAASPAEMRGSHWAFRPVQKPSEPAVKDAAWGANPLDRFILAGLEAKGLHPTRPADARTLIRRVTYDLIGLPPTPEEVEAFVNDHAPDAYGRLVDRLLARPEYGERWARHWLDVARYADTKGYVFNEERRYPYAYTYRDYVIQSFNEDKPYDRFVVEQLAADRLPQPPDAPALAALGYLTLGRRFLNNQQDIIDDRIDVTMRGLQGMTVACARCHDHKFDPIPTKDYYSLYGVFASSHEPAELPLVGKPKPSPELTAFQAELKKRTDAVDKYKTEHKKELDANNRKFHDELVALQKQVEHWNATGAGAPPRAMVLNDLPNPVTPHVLKRGTPGLVGDQVPRQFLEVLAPVERKPFTNGSGRLDLAQAIASKDNPLTARVFVNRVWGWHFGQGLVRTPSDFGTRGERPTHPELLDWLAADFMENGWSIKKLHRLIVTSATYREASDEEGPTAAADPENRLLGRRNRRRLEFEALHDGLLAAAGRLDLTHGGPAVDLTTAPFTRRRAVYGFVDRQNLPGLFRTFDFASPDASTPQRFTTTVPQQALFLMNSPFVLEQARHFVARPDVATLPREEDRIDRLHRLAYGRPAEADEVQLGLKFLHAAQAAGPANTKLTPWEQYGQVLLLANEFAFVD